jgi:sphingomyelin phosphodiesterase 2
MMMRHPALGCSLSDHFSVEVTLAFRPTAGTGPGVQQHQHQHQQQQPVPASVESPHKAPARHQLHLPSTRTVTRNGVIEVHPPSFSSSSSAARGPNVPPDSSGEGTPPLAANDDDDDDDDDDDRSNSNERRNAGIANGAFLQSPTDSEYPPSQASSPFPRTTKTPNKHDTNDNDAPATSPHDSDTATATDTAPTASRPLTHHTFQTLLACIDAYTARERAQRRWRGRHFFLALAATAACLVAVWFVDGRPYAAFLLCLASTLNLAAGLVDGLVALLFLGWEIKALKEFRWEVANAEERAAAAAMQYVQEQEQEQVHEPDSGSLDETMKYGSNNNNKSAQKGMNGRPSWS